MPAETAATELAGLDFSVDMIGTRRCRHRGRVICLWQTPSGRWCWTLSGCAHKRYAATEEQAAHDAVDTIHREAQPPARA